MGLQPERRAVTMAGMASINSPITRVPSASLLAGALLLPSVSARAEVTLDTLFQDHAVLQRDRAIPVRGVASPGEKVTVTFGSVSVGGTAGSDGRFSVALPAMPASREPRELVVRGETGEARAHDILVGEVWFCSGQSNMEWTVDGADESDRAKSAAAKLPIRSFKAPHVTANEPKNSVPGQWRVASAETVGGFTAVGFWFGADLARSFDLEVPIGLVDISWGGTRIEPWIPLDEMASSDFRQRAEDLRAAIDASRAIKPEDTPANSTATGPRRSPTSLARRRDGRRPTCPLMVARADGHRQRCPRTTRRWTVGSSASTDSSGWRATSLCRRRSRVSRSRCRCPRSTIATSCGSTACRWARR
jgi:hypothetical protein